MVKISLEIISPDKVKDVAKVYKEVFSGHPWHEDLICKNSLDDTCSTQYTFVPCELYDRSAKGEIVNDCRGEYVERKNSEGKQEIVLLSSKKGLETCVGCEDELKTIPFYPGYRNHQEIIEEALEEKGFIGYLARDDSGKLIGFSWGYLVPKNKTVSVNFPILEPLFEKNNVDLNTCFYTAESGIIGSAQGKGFGGVLSGMRLLNANKTLNPKALIARTLNPAVHAYFTNSFSGVPAKELFKDPEASGSWFMWDFKDFDARLVQEKIKVALQ